jgi:hypothetical protein
MNESIVENLCTDFSKNETELDLITSGFSKGEIVFKIILVSENGELIDNRMVNTKEDYERLLYTHIYQPLLFSINIYLRLAYLYGCLNLKFKNPQTKEYIFMWRKIRTNEWNKWFKINPYKDDLYNECSIIEHLI